ncbi:MAG: hypothetical protein JSU94_07670 [Phycisphaerales bacterium]|nr:MAG: hypothetical protein JSU94_07670 [Phycisphaerales bacterium]
MKYDRQSRRPAGSAVRAVGRQMIATLTAIIAVSAAAGASQSREPAVLTKDEMLHGLRAARSGIEDLTVSFSFNFVNPPAGNLHARSHKTISVKGEKTCLDHVYGAARQYDDRSFQTQAAYNGKRSTFHSVDQRKAYVGIKRMHETDTQGSGFFDIMLLNPPRPEVAAAGNADQNLESLLSAEHSRLRRDMETVDGRACHVVDMIDPRSGQRSMTVWIDCERGFLPLRQLYYGGPERADILMELSIEKAVEVREGLWMAVCGRKKTHPLPGVPQLDRPFEMVLEVDGWREGKPALAVNSGLSDEYFDLWKRLPLGTTLMDLDTELYWTVGGEDFEGFAQSFESVLADQNLPVPERAGATHRADANDPANLAEVDSHVIAEGASARPANARPPSGRSLTGLMATLVGLLVIASVGVVAILTRRR